MAIPTSFLNICDAIASPTAPLCTKAQARENALDALCDFVTWAFNSDGTATTEFKSLFSSLGVPTACILHMPVDVVPDGYLLCNGQEVSRATYATLFARVGTSFGTPSGATVFKVPDLQGKFLIGSSGTTYPVGGTGGAASVTLTTSQIPTDLTVTVINPSTGATLSKQTFIHNSNQGISVDGSPNNVDQGGALLTTLAGLRVGGGGQAHDNLPPYQAGLWLIKT